MTIYRGIPKVNKNKIYLEVIILNILQRNHTNDKMLYCKFIIVYNSILYAVKSKKIQL